MHLFSSSGKNEPVKARELTIDSNIRISENDFVYFEVKSVEPLSPYCFLWLSDFRLGLNLLNATDKGYRYSVNLSTFFDQEDFLKFSHQFYVQMSLTYFHKIFLNYYGECRVELEGIDGSREFIEVSKINIDSDKISEIDSLLDYLLEKDQYYWNTVSLTKVEASDRIRDKENFIWTLKNLASSLKVIDEVLVPNLDDAIIRLTPNQYVDRPTLNSEVSEESILWLLENCNMLEPSTVYEPESFLILNRPYVAGELLLKRLEDDTDVPENQIIHGYLSDVHLFLRDSSLTITRFLDNIADQSDFKSQIYKSYYKRLMISISEIELTLDRISIAVSQHIPVKRLHLNVGLSNRFQSKQHYYETYLQISKWINRSDSVFSTDELFSGAKDISKLYEMFCLFKIIDTLSNDMGYSLLDSTRNQVGEEEVYNPWGYQHAAIKSRYQFVKEGGNSISLFYDHLPDSLVTVARNSRGYRPDFTLEISGFDTKSRYVIFDAKYKRVGTIQNYDYQEVSLKYLHGIGLRGGGYFPVLGLFLINPISNSRVSYYQSREYSEESHSLPIIGRVEMSVESDARNFFKEVLSKMLNISDSYEYTC